MSQSPASIKPLLVTLVVLRIILPRKRSNGTYHGFPSAPHSRDCDSPATSRGRPRTRAAFSRRAFEASIVTWRSPYASVASTPPRETADGSPGDLCSPGPTHLFHAVTRVPARRVQDCDLAPPEKRLGRRLLVTSTFSGSGYIALPRAGWRSKRSSFSAIPAPALCRSGLLTWLNTSSARLKRGTASARPG